MHIHHFACVAVGRAAAGVGGHFARGGRPGVDWRERKPERLPGLCGGQSFGGTGRSSRCGQGLGVAGEADVRRTAAGGRRATADSAAALGRGGDRLHPRWDLGPQELPAEQRRLHGATTGDDVCVVHAEPLANKKHHGGAGGIDALCPIPAD